jgi:hypothetical protein
MIKARSKQKSLCLEKGNNAVSGMQWQFPDCGLGHDNLIIGKRNGCKIIQKRVPKTVMRH